MNKYLDETEMNEEKLKNLLDIYGADLSRMPKDVANKIETFLKETNERKWSSTNFDQTKIEDLFNEAKQLDQTLDQLRPTPKFDVGALEDKIFDQVFSNDQSEVISFEEQKILREEKKQTSSMTGNESEISDLFTFKSTGLIAASLLAGLLIGSLGTIDHLLFDENSLLIASNSLTDDVLYLGTEYSLDAAVFSNNE